MTLWGVHYTATSCARLLPRCSTTLLKLRCIRDYDHRRTSAQYACGPEYGKTERLRLSPTAIVGHLQAANARVQAGTFSENDREVRVEAGNLFNRREDLEAVVVSVVRGHPIYLRDVAETIADGASEPANYVVFGTTNAGSAAQVGARQYRP